MGGVATDRRAAADPVLLENAERTVSLVLSTRGPTWWVRRINETVQIQPSDMVRRSVEVHADLRRILSTWSSRPERLAVPIALLSRHNRREIVVRDGTGRVVPTLTLTEERTLAYEACAQFLVNALASDSTEPDPQGSETDAGREGREERERLLDGLLDATWELLVQPCPKNSTQQPVQMLGEYTIPTGGRWNLFRSALDRFRYSFMLLVEVPGPELANRLVFTYAYDDIAFVDGAGPDVEPGLAASCRLIWGESAPLQPDRRKWHRRVARYIAGTPAVDRVIETPAASFTESYHVDVLTPSDLFIVGAALGITQISATNEESVVAVEGDGDAPLDRAHMSFRIQRRKMSRAVVRTFLIAPNYGLINIAVITALVSAVILLLSGYVLFGINVAGWWNAEGWSRDELPLDRSASTAVLLVVPSVTQLVAFRYGEARLVALVFRPLRRTLVVTSAPSVLLAVVVAFRANTDHPGKVWQACLIVTLVGLAIIFRQRRAVIRAVRDELRSKPEIAANSPHRGIHVRT